MHKNHLMTPGPTELPPSVLAIGGQQILHHRSQLFRSQFLDVCENLKKVFLTIQPVLTLNAGATGGMESCIVNLSDPGDLLIVIAGGVFGERWADIGEKLGRQVVRIEVPWGKAVHPDQVEAELARYPHTVLVLGTLTETSTGILHPIREIAKIVSRSAALFVVDAISGLGACEFRMDEWEVDVVVAGIQKGLMCPPGISLIALSEKALSLMKTKNKEKFYWSYEKALKGLAATPFPETPWTPNVSLILQLKESLHLILEEGLESVWQRHKLLAKATRAGIKAMGLKIFNEDSFCPIVTVICSPEELDSTLITKKMSNDWGITISPGQGKLKQQLFRIGHVGYCDRSDILMTLSVLEVVLSELHLPIQLGKGLKASQEVFLNPSPRELIYV